MRLASSRWSDSIVDIGVVWFCSFTLLAYVAGTLWKLVASGGDNFAYSVRSLRNKLTRSTRFVLRKACTQTVPEAPNAVDVAASLVFKSKRLKFIRRTLQSCSPVIVLVLGIVVYLCKTEAANYDGPNDVHPFDGHMVSASLVILMAVLARFYDNQPTGKVCVSLEVAVIFRLTWLLWNYPSGSYLLFDRTFVWCIRLGSALLPTDFRLTAVLNAMYSLSSCVAWASHLQKEPELAAKLVHDPYTFFALMEALSITAIIVVAWDFETRMREEASALVLAKSSKNFRTAVARLLNSIYDVVVEMDDKLRFVDNAETLAGMLLHGWKRSLQGVYLEKLLAGEEDRVRLKQHMARNQHVDNDASMAVPIRLHMKDSSGTVIYVEILSSQFENLTGEDRYLVGIRELEMESQITAKKSPDELTQQSNDVDLLVDSPVPQADVLTGFRRPSLKGTPAQLPQDDALSATISNLSVAKYLNSSLKETPIETRKRSIMQSLLCWNLQMPRASCCSYHALLKEGSQVVRSLRQHMCSDVTKHLENLSQCSSCGILMYIEDGYTEGLEECLCDHCEATGALASSVKRKLEL